MRFFSGEAVLLVVGAIASYRLQAPCSNACVADGGLIFCLAVKTFEIWRRDAARKDAEQVRIQDAY